ncbi:MAG: hypothetical protein JXB36_17440 [Gammaproteobacteria bacterium]|nr:hypothetical protein [Gammaproteobacteria bacterium]
MSFAGADASGRAAFALDTNRGRAAGDYQAEHFVAMYDERTGWVHLEGYTDYPNTERALLDYPDSPYFDFAGAPYALESIASPVNGLSLSIGPLEPRVTTRSDSTLFSMASAPATLSWSGRTFEGRVIYEFLAMRDENRLARGISGLLEVLTAGPDFQGLYLATETGDLYVHSAPASAAASTGNPLMAFWAAAERNLRADDVRFDVTAFDAAPGFYRWPASWSVRWRSDCGAAQLSVRSLDHDTQANWITGGFAMRAVEGEIVCGAESMPVFGFAELIR